jgi:hypothetical protein
MAKAPAKTVKKKVFKKKEKKVPKGHSLCRAAGVAHRRE